MKYASAAAFRAALEEGLRTRARETGIPLIRLRKLVVFDRLMARLLVVAPNRWVLKGAAALLFRIGPEFRTTQDLDLGRWDDEQAATQDFLEAQSVELDEYFHFAIEATDRSSGPEGSAVRYHASADLAGRRFEDISVDVGFEEAVYETSERVSGPDLLGFAGIAPIEVPVLAIEHHVVQKVHAYTRTYGSGVPSTRPKDLIDLVLMSREFDFRGDRLRQALEATFEARGTHLLPSELPPPPAAWGAPYKKMAAEVGLAPELEDGYRAACGFLDPVLGSTAADTVWSAAKGTWQVR